MDRSCRWESGRVSEMLSDGLEQPIPNEGADVAPDRTEMREDRKESPYPIPTPFKI
jgi:hypothetical protein